MAPAGPSGPVSRHPLLTYGRDINCRQLLKIAAIPSLTGPASRILVATGPPALPHSRRGSAFYLAGSNSCHHAIKASFNPIDLSRCPPAHFSPTLGLLHQGSHPTRGDTVCTHAANRWRTTSHWRLPGITLLLAGSALATLQLGGNWLNPLAIWSLHALLGLEILWQARPRTRLAARARS